jgi:hypothetical protein
MRSKVGESDQAMEPIPHPALKLGYVSPKKFNCMMRRIENSMRIVASLIAAEGDVYLPIFQRLENELSEHKLKEKSLRRALEISQKDSEV